MIRILRNFDYTLLIVPILLSAFGVVIVYSSSMVTAVFEGLGSTHYLIKQLQWFILSLVFFFIFSFIPYKYYQNHTKKIIGVSIVLDRKSTRLNSSHVAISYAVFCLKKKKIRNIKTVN